MSIYSEANNILNRCIYVTATLLQSLGVKTFDHNVEQFIQDFWLAFSFKSFNWNKSTDESKWNQEDVLWYGVCLVDYSCTPNGLFQQIREKWHNY